MRNYKTYKEMYEDEEPVKKPVAVTTDFFCRVNEEITYHDVSNQLKHEEDERRENDQGFNLYEYNGPT
jgi:hypothetical protein|tara:strand:+ start:1042 stop:1245 length:204 start_codon:yes stop_codon:yes gene_type:complete